MTSLFHTTARSEPLSRPRVWAWPLGALLGFPIGGEIANVLVGRVDSIGAALAGGLLAGVVIGAAQWIVLRRIVTWVWIPATSVGMAFGLAAGAAIVDYGIGRGSLVVMGAATGAVVGGLQAVLLVRAGIEGAAWWAAANPVAWALGWLATSYVITKNVEEQFTNFGAGGTLLFALVTGVLLAFMFGRTDPSARAT
jgi:hypothetical protein